MTADFPDRDERDLAEALDAALDAETQGRSRAGPRAPTDDLADLAAGLRAAMPMPELPSGGRTESARGNPGGPGGQTARQDQVADRSSRHIGCWSSGRGGPVECGAAAEPDQLTRLRFRLTLTMPAATWRNTTRQKRSSTSNVHRRPFSERR